MFWNVLEKMIPLCICMAFGYIARKLKILDDKLSSGLSTLLLQMILPCLVFASMQREFSAELFEDGMLLLLVSFLLHGVGYVFAVVLCRLVRVPKKQRPVWYFMMIFPNVAYMGLPVLEAVLGSESLFFGAMNNISFNTVLFSFGSGIISGKREKPRLRQFVNPTLIATALGFLCFVASVRIYSPLMDGLKLIGGMTTPVSMIIIGGLLAKGGFIGIFKDYRLLAASAARLLVFPVIVFFVLRIFMNPEQTAVLTLLMAMPAAAVTAIFAERYDGDTQTASVMVFVTTLLCVLTLPLISMMMDMFQKA